MDGSKSSTGDSSEDEEKVLGRSYAEVFREVESKKRDHVVKMVNQKDISLGMIDSTTGRH